MPSRVHLSQIYMFYGAYLKLRIFCPFSLFLKRKQQSGDWKIISWLSSGCYTPSRRCTHKFLKLVQLFIQRCREIVYKIANKGTAACRRIGISLCVSKVNEFKNNHLKRNSPLMSLVQNCAQIVLALKSETQRGKLLSSY